MDAEVILLIVAPAGLAVMSAWLLPRFSRNFLGPAFIVTGVVAFLVILNQSNLGRDAWGPARAVVALFVGGVGIVTGLLLIVVGAIGSKQAREPGTASPPPYSRDNPYRLPGPGLFTPKWLFIAAVGGSILLLALMCVYSWVN